MSRLALHFPRLAKVTLYGVLALSFGSGLAWMLLEKYGQVEGEFGPEKAPCQPLLLKIHGASAMLAMIGFGYLLATHVHVGWRSRRNRPLGVALVVLVTAMVASGYGLFYLGDEALRATVSLVHFWTGCFIPVVLVAHVVTGHLRRGSRP